MRNYFNVSNPRAFDNVSQNSGRVIKGSVIMGFTGDPQKVSQQRSRQLKNDGVRHLQQKAPRGGHCSYPDTDRSTKCNRGGDNQQTMDKELKVLRTSFYLPIKTIN
jgi:hypothetical protein